jgi:hypothetical protein
MVVASGLGVGGLAVLFVALEVEERVISTRINVIEFIITTVVSGGGKRALTASLKVSETKQVGSSFEGLLSFLWFTDSTQKKLESGS